MKNRVKILRILLGGVVGTICAVVSVYVGGIFIILLKLFCLVAMCVCLCGFKKKLFWYILLTTAYTFVVGGCVVGLFFLTGTEFSLDNVLTYNNSVPMGIYLLAIVLTAFLIYSTVLFVGTRAKTQKFIVKAVLHLSKDFDILGFCDSGNTLEVEGVAVCFAVGSLKKIISADITEALLSNSAKQVSYLTMAGESTAFALPCKLTVFKKTYDILLAFPKLNQDTNYDILLHSSMQMESGGASA